VLYENITLQFEHLNQSNTTTLDQPNYLGDCLETGLKTVIIYAFLFGETSGA